jgi:hypothetical protein
MALELPTDSGSRSVAYANLAGIVTVVVTSAGPGAGLGRAPAPISRLEQIGRVATSVAPDRPQPRSASRTPAGTVRMERSASRVRRLAMMPRPNALVIDS